VSASGCDTVNHLNRQAGSDLYSNDVRTNPNNPKPLCLTERLYSVPEVASFLNLSTDATRALFIEEPGVIVITRRRRGTRIYRTLRIPQGVLQRKVKSLTVGGGQ
jgi:hypothetical protein